MDSDNSNSVISLVIIIFILTYDNIKTAENCMTKFFGHLFLRLRGHYSFVLCGFLKERDFDHWNNQPSY